MSRFNLLEENWIRVLEEGEMKEVSLITLFENAEKYRCLAGEMATQNFAMLRFLLAVLHTVFSRVNADGEAYEFLEIDEKFRQKEAVSEDDEEEYNDALMETWKTLWQRGKFPSVVRKYLEAWKDHFYLLDEKSPFYQVTKEEIDSLPRNYQKLGPILGKQFNRTISESNNKVALFSPKLEECKSKMLESELARWLIMLQGYFGNFDKVKFCQEYTPSIGWLYELGGIYLRGRNLFETLMMNFKITVEQVGEEIPRQSPCWENSGVENIKRAFHGVENNLAALYTNWSRAMLVNPELNFFEDILVEVVKLPKLDYSIMEIEPMTLWEYDMKGDNKYNFVPKCHEPNQALWRSYGSIAIPDEIIQNGKEPGIITWLNKIRPYFYSHKLMISAVGIQDDGIDASRMMVNEINDDLALHEIVLFEKGVEGWVARIKGIVDETKEIISTKYRKYLKDIAELRRKKSYEGGNNKKKIEDKNLTIYLEDNLKQIYFEIDKPFRNWLIGIEISSKKEEKAKEWKDFLIRFIKEHAFQKIKEADARDIQGTYIEDGKIIINIFTIYESFCHELKKYEI